MVPPFYFPGGKPVPEEVRVSAQAKIDAFFDIYPDGLTIPAVKELVKEVTHGCCCHRPESGLMRHSMQRPQAVVVAGV